MLCYIHVLNLLIAQQCSYIAWHHKCLKSGAKTNFVELSWDVGRRHVIQSKRSLHCTVFSQKTEIVNENTISNNTTRQFSIHSDWNLN